MSDVIGSQVLIRHLRAKLLGRELVHTSEWLQGPPHEWLLQCWPCDPGLKWNSTVHRRKNPCHTAKFLCSKHPFWVNRNHLVQWDFYRFLLKLPGTITNHKCICQSALWQQDHWQHNSQTSPFLQTACLELQKLSPNMKMLSEVRRFNANSVSHLFGDHSRL